MGAWCCAGSKTGAPQREWTIPAACCGCRNRTLIGRHHRVADHRINAARFLAAKSLDASDLLAIPSPNRPW